MASTDQSLSDGRPILVTGCSGFVGANLALHFLAQGYAVVGVEGPSLTEWRTRGVKGLQLVRADLRDESAVKSLINAVDPIAILNCAAYGAYSSQKDVTRIYDVNFKAVRLMLEAVRGRPHFRAFVQAGSSSEYGMNCAAPREDADVVPDSDYAVSKLAATSLVRYNALQHGVPGWSLRLYSVYGPYEDLSRLIPQLLLKARERKLPPLVNPMISRDFVHVTDVARAFELVVRRADELPRGEIYNIGTGQRTTLEHLVAVARSCFDIASVPAWGSMADRKWDHPDWYANPHKANDQLGWRADMSLETGLQNTMRWLVENPDLVTEGLAHTVVATRS